MEDSVVFSISNIKNNFIKVNVSEVPSGFYFFSIKTISGLNKRGKISIIH
jgi:hypothetical protein